MSSGLGRSTRQRRPGKTGKPTKIFPLPRTSVACSVCHPACGYDVYQDGHCAAGVFAAGHLGELAWQVPFELADGAPRGAGVPDGGERPSMSLLS